MRIRGSGRLGFVCDFDEDICGDLLDPSCVRTVALFDSGVTRREWGRVDCFLEDLDEVVEAEGAERNLVCSDFEYMRIRNYWTEDTPLDRHYAIWVAMGEEGAAVWLERGDGSVERIAHMSSSKFKELKEAVADSGFSGWRRRYEHEGWYIGSNAWSITLIRGSKKASVDGDDAYHHALKGLCDELRSMGLPVEFWENHGLKYSPLRTKKKRRKRLAAKQVDG